MNPCDKAMNKIILISASVIMFFSCQEKQATQHDADAKRITDSLLACKADSIEREKNSTGKVSELALLMRQMETELKAHKEALKSGAERNLNWSHEGIQTVQSTKANLRNDDYRAYGNSYLIGVDALSKAEGDSIVAKHNALVGKCIDCHKTFCTGPIVRIKKLRINPQNIAIDLK